MALRILLIQFAVLLFSQVSLGQHVTLDNDAIEPYREETLPCLHIYGSAKKVVGQMALVEASMDRCIGRLVLRGEGDNKEKMQSCFANFVTRNDRLSKRFGSLMARYRACIRELD
jgi:hypothetical protein